MQTLQLTITDQDSEFVYPLIVRNLRIIGSLIFIHCLDVTDAARLLNWIIEITVDTGHMVLEIDAAVSEMVVIDLCLFDQLLNLKLENSAE